MISHHDVAVGDVVFCTPGHDPLTRMISKYDHSPFSHIGVVVEPGHVASCRADSDMLGSGDIGGVRIDTFRFFQVDRGRDLYRARPDVDDATRRRIVKFACDLAEKNVSGRSSFSYAKMFQCAVAVEASLPSSEVAPVHRAELVDLAIDAARAWAWTQEKPSFFCAEFVVSAFGWEFSRDDLAPRDPAPPAASTRSVPAPSPAPAAHHRHDLVGLAHDILRYRPNPVEAWTLLRLVEATQRYSPGFMAEAAHALWDYLHETAAPGVHVDEFLPAGFPNGLVTPRMVRESRYVDEPELIAGGPSGG